MNLFVCIDDNNGMMFNNRRQSRDSAVVEKIIQLSQNSKLVMTAYSKKLFDDNPNIIVAESVLDSAEKGDFCFVENKIENLDMFDKIFVFKWNRNYPFDLTFDFNLKEQGFVLTETQEFSGSSHDNITLDIYARETL